MANSISKTSICCNVGYSQKGANRNKKNNKRNSIIDNVKVEINKTGESCRNSKKKNDSLLMDTVINNL